jgi:uncharacterized protein involved in exopolysaccharide biosynthesis
MEIFDRPLRGEGVFRSDDSRNRELNDDAATRLRDVLAKFWTRKWLIFTFVFICACLSYAAAKIITPLYIGEALVMITPQQAAEPATNASLQAAIHGGPEAVPSEAIVLQSRDLASQTIDNLHLDQDPLFNPSLSKPKHLPQLLDPMLAVLEQIQDFRRQIGKFLAGVEAPTNDETVTGSDPGHAAHTLRTAMADALLENLHVETLPHSNVIKLWFRSPRANLAAAVPNTMVQLYLEQMAQGKDEALKQERERLDKLVLPMLREKLNKSERALADYRQKSGLVSDQNPAVLTQELNDINTQLSAARGRKAEVTARLSQVEALASSFTPTVAGSSASPVAASESPILQQLSDQEVQLKAQLASLRSSLGPNHPKTVQLTAQLDELRSAIRRESVGLIGRLRAEMGASDATQVVLDRRAKEFIHQFALVNGGDFELQNLIRDVEVDRQTYERYLARSDEIYASMGHAQPDARFISSAAVPLKPTFPNTKQMVLL